MVQNTPPSPTPHLSSHFVCKLELRLALTAGFLNILQTTIQLSQYMHDESNHTQLTKDCVGSELWDANTMALTQVSEAGATEQTFHKHGSVNEHHPNSSWRLKPG